MKTVFFVRHAKSSWKDYSLMDIERPLNKRGKRDAPFMGELLAGKNVYPDVMLTSPSKRTKDTAKKVAKALDFSEQIHTVNSLYHSDVSTILSTLHDLEDDIAVVMLFVHNPGITDTVNYCSQSAILNIPTTGIAGVNFEVENWDEVDDNGELFLYEYPKKYYNELGEGPLLQP